MNRTLAAPQRNDGDSDASGDNIERDWVARTGCWDRVERVLLTHTQVEMYGLPAAEGKAGDPRWRAFAARYDLDPATPVQWKVEALPVEEFRRLVLDAVDPYVDRAILRAQLAAEEPQHRQLVALAEEWVAGRWRNRRGDGSANGEPP
ncbi:hypothetical protein [Streptomyces sp. NPDC050538]|uniref:hypothetical protein n=1 Tax=Streptomyces sp. NPDC050538 TaxID=3365627 RepID=UPI0037984727